MNAHHRTACHHRRALAGLVVFAVVTGCEAPPTPGFPPSPPRSGDEGGSVETPERAEGHDDALVDPNLGPLPIASGLADSAQDIPRRPPEDPPPPSASEDSPPLWLDRLAPPTAEVRTPVEGVVFRTWAPFADRVTVAGTFNDWNIDAHPLSELADGYWSGRIEDAAAGDEYLFVIEKDGVLHWKADPRAAALVNSASNAVVYDKGAYQWQSGPFEMPPRDTLVLYEMHIGTFNDEPGGAPGTFDSATEKLDHLVELGINAVELMPVAEFAGDFSWGYNTAFPFAVESAYGGPDALKRFVDACHARGIAVLLDVVHNHYGPSDLSMWCYDGECLGEENGGAYFYTDHRRESGWGPRPDYGRWQVRRFIRDNTRWWLKEFRADGLRWDSTVNIRTGGGEDIADGWWLLQSTNNIVDDEMPAKLMIAEDLQQNPWLTTSTGAGGAGFDSQWEAAFFHPVNDAIITPSDSTRDMWAVRDAIAHSYPEAHHARVIYTESHDEVANGRQRIPSMISPDDPTSFFARKRSTLGAALVMTSPGLPMIFQGQEMLEDEWFRDTDPLDWQKADDHAGIVALYRDLIHLRRNLGENTAGLLGAGVNVHHVNNGAKVIAMHRWQYGGVGDDVMVVLNFSATDYPSYDVGAPYGGTWHVAFNSDDEAYGFEGKGSAGDVEAMENATDGMQYRLRVSLPAYSALILRR